MASHVMTWAERMCLRSAANDLHTEFRGMFCTETRALRRLRAPAPANG